MHKFIRAEAFYAQNKSDQTCKVFYRTKSMQALMRENGPPDNQIDKNHEMSKIIEINRIYLRNNVLDCQMAI